MGCAVMEIDHLPGPGGQWCCGHPFEQHKDYHEADACMLHKADTINPPHYKQHPSGIECITITEHFNFNLGNTIKYVWRAGLKSESAIEDLKKAAWYLAREIERLTK